MKKIKISLLTFIIRFLTKYSIYTYILLLISSSSFYLFITIFTKVDPLSFRILSFFFLIPFFYSFIRLLIILSSTKYKWRYYKISLYRLEKKGYKEDYFKYEMFEPCMRLIIKDILHQYGKDKEYLSLYDKYSKKNVYIEDFKENLLIKVKSNNSLRTKE